MAIPAWLWPPVTPTTVWPFSVARSVAAIVSGAGVLWADWSTPALWFYGGSGAFVPTVLASGTPGLADITGDGGTGAWTVSYGGALWHRSPTATLSLTQMPSGVVYLGCSPSGHVLSSDGMVRTSGGVTLGNWPTPAAQLGSSGTTLVALLAASGVGTMSNTGVTGLIAFPAGLTTPSCLSVAAGLPLAIAGWQTAATLAGATALVLNPQLPTTLAMLSSGSATLWTTPSAFGDAWTPTQTLSGLANLTAGAWAADGGHIMATATTGGGEVQNISYAAGTLALVQTLAVSGAIDIGMADDSLHALVAQSGLAQLATLTFGGTWAAGTAVTGLTGITGVARTGPNTQVASYASGLAYLALVSGAWSITNTLALGYTPGVLTTDNFGQVYAAASGRLSVADSSGNLLGTGSFVGLPSAIAVQAGRVVLAVPASNALYIFGPSAPGSWTRQSSGTIALGATVGLGLSAATLFVMGSGATQLFGFSGTPFMLTSPVSGAAAQRSAGSWTVTPLGVGHTPAAIGYDGSGNLRVATTQNTIWSLTSGGAVNSSGIIAVYPLQVSGTALGVSSLLAFSSGMLGVTSMPGVLLEIS